MSQPIFLALNAGTHTVHFADWSCIYDHNSVDATDGSVTALHQTQDYLGYYVFGKGRSYLILSGKSFHTGLDWVDGSDKDPKSVSPVVPPTP